LIHILPSLCWQNNRLDFQLGRFMPSTAPLQILLFRDREDVDMLPYEEAIVRALQGGKEAGGYLVSGEDLGIQLRVFSGAPQVEHTAPQVKRTAAQTLDSFCHTLTVVLIDHALLKKDDGALWDWLSDCWEHADASNGRHGMLAVPMEERTGEEFCGKREPLETLQLLQVHVLGEKAIRPAMLALRVLHESRILLADALPLTQPPGCPPGFLRLFISHAKIDGLPLAQALRYQIKTIGWLQGFYDADDLPAGRNWQKELERGVGSSLIVMLRTEIYDSRHWCQKEVLWADEYATPAVLVEARTELQHSAGSLPLERVPVVRIPDGNLVRVLFFALREGLRFLHFMRRVEEMKRTGDLPDPVELRVFSFSPSMPALLRACQSIMSSKAPAETPSLILYPDPTLRAGVYEAALALVEKYSPQTRLVTPNTLAATKGDVP
jgi:TIR domain-containing protein